MLKEEMERYRQSLEKEITEEQIARCIKVSQEKLVALEEDSRISYGEFLFGQMRFISKKWWLLQITVLLLASRFLSFDVQDFGYQRVCCSLMALFVVFIVPEVWKNRMNGAMEIEESCFYTLRQITSARLLLFSLVDVFLLTIFCFVVVRTGRMDMEQLLVNVLLPVSISLCICFGCFCSRRKFNEVFAIFASFFGNTVWNYILYTTKFYNRISFAIWAAIFAGTVLLILFFVYQLISENSKREDLCLS